MSATNKAAQLARWFTPERFLRCKNMSFQFRFSCGLFHEIF